jgi:hypothetical protein
MAKDEATVELEDDAVVTVDVTDNPDLVTAGEKPGEGGGAGEQDPPQKTPVPRKQIALEAPQISEEDRTKSAVSEAVKNAEALRAAAEATAQAERQRADNALRSLQQSTQEKTALQEQVEDRELTIINSGIESAKREVEAYETENRTALEAGDFVKASAAHTKLSRAAAALDRLEDAKASYEAGARKTPTTEGRVEAPAASTGTPFEQYVVGFSPRAQAWLRAHPECAPATVGGNTVSNAKMMAGHWAALGAGVQEGSDDYFRVIEEHTGYRAPARAADAEDVPATPQKKPVRQAQPSAPPTRDPPAGNGQRTTRSVTLTKDQQEAAKISWPNLDPREAFAKYARNLIELEAEGKMGRLTH